MDTSAVKLSPWVTHPEAPTATPMPPIYNEAWNAVRSKSFLRVQRKEGVVTVSGLLPSAELREAVVAALSGDKGAVTVKADGLRTGPFVRTAHFAQAGALPAFLKDFFQAPGTESFVADGDTVRLRGTATPELEARWRELLLPLADRQEVAADLQIYPSRFHFRTTRRSRSCRP